MWLILLCVCVCVLLLQPSLPVLYTLSSQATHEAVHLLCRMLVFDRSSSSALWWRAVMPASPSATEKKNSFWWTKSDKTGCSLPIVISIVKLYIPGGVFPAPLGYGLAGQPIGCRCGPGRSLNQQCPLFLIEGAGCLCSELRNAMMTLHPLL